jgi:hypothetical protein
LLRTHCGHVDRYDFSINTDAKQFVDEALRLMPE